MKKIAVLLFSLLITFALDAQQKISGTVRDKATGEALIGANVRSSDSKYLAATDIEGHYQLNLPDGDYSVVASYVGYKPLTAKLKVSGKNATLDFQLENITLDEVEVSADVAIDRKTPVAFTNIGEVKLKEELGARDITMVINSTPGAYATESGGGSGDSRVNIRGFDQRNVAVMVDGVPVNDMENGWVYWSNWDGLGGVTRNMQIQRGLGASKLALPSVGGTINIITKGMDQKQSFSIKKEMGSNMYDNTSFGFNSGPLKHGWGVTLAGSRKTGDGWVDQTWTDAWSYFAKIQKRFDKHTFAIGANGSPQLHGQRIDRMPIGIYNKKLAQDLGVNTDSLYGANNTYTTLTQGERGLQYNPHWGTINYPDGQTGELNTRVNFYHKPQLSFSHYWNPNDKFYMSTVLYASFGKGGGTNINSSVARDTLTGQFNLTPSYNSNSTLIDALYSTTETKSSRYIYASVNNHHWYGALSTATWKPSDKLSVLMGVDARYYKGEHYRQVYDLMGGDYIINTSDESQPGGMGYLNYSMKRTGDKITYYNDSYVQWGGLFAQTEYKADKWSSFITVTASETGYQRRDYFRKQDIVLPDTTFVEAVGFGDTLTYNGVKYTIDSPEAQYTTTRKVWLPGFTVKGGYNYNINDNHNVFINAGYMNMAPRFNNVFDNNNKEFLGIENQAVYAVEMGYGARYKKFATNVNLYYTYWHNKPPDFAPTINTPDGPLSYNINGMDARHMGGEIDFTWNPLNKLQLEGIVSIGDWTYQSAKKAYIYDQNETLVDSVEFSAIGVHVGDAAQTQLGITARYSPFKNFYVKARFTSFSRYYASFDPLTLVVEYDAQGDVISDSRDRESWQLPAYSLLDFYTGYEFKAFEVGERKFFMTVNGTMSNVLNTVYISDAQNGSGFNPSTALVYMGLGRRFTAGLRFNF